MLALASTFPDFDSYSFSVKRVSASGSALYSQNYNDTTLSQNYYFVSSSSAVQSSID